LKSHTGFSTRGRPRKNKGPAPGIKTVDIALEIFSEIVRFGGGVSLSKLSGATGIAPSKLHRYLVSFTRSGFLVQIATTGLYDLGPAARRLGSSALQRFDESGYIRRVVEKISADTGYAVGLYVWTDLGPTLVQIELGSYAFPVSFRIGSAMPLCASATGRVFLAHMPQERAEVFIDKEFSETSEHWYFPTKKALHAELDVVRSGKVYATLKTVLTPCLTVVAPVFGENGSIFCAMSAFAPAEHADDRRRERLVKVLDHESSRIADDLFPHPTPR
jgi:DNA-binding IclR family transcriptional regulator